MSQHLTIAYITARHDPKIDWFLDSLCNQMPYDGGFLTTIVVDFYKDVRNLDFRLYNVKHVAPKPCVWAGPHKLTKVDWFSAANARNTALCHAPDGWICYVDDLSVLMPNWLNNVRASMNWNGITLGAYRKVKGMKVENGIVTDYDKDWTGGRDSRWYAGSDSGSVPANGDMLYGCSFLAPVEALLTVGGHPEFCNGLGFEDVILGQALANAGFHFKYNRNMLTFESEEHHGLEPAFRRDCFEKHPNDPTDKGHSVLNMVKGGMKYFENYYEGGIRCMREEVLSGKPFPIVNNPQNEWHTGRLLSDL